MLFFSTCLVAVAAFVSGKECDQHGILIYEDLGCTAEYSDHQQCPTKYSCQGLESSNKCHFRGRSYEDGEEVQNSLSYASCSVGCFCETENGRAGFTCAVLDCPEWLGVSTTSGCYSTYALGKCCSVDEICPPFDHIGKCVVDNKEYKEGESFRPSGTCFECICQKGFGGKLEEPFCKKISCGQQLIRGIGYKIQGFCAPFYSKQSHKEVLCCPDDWICPDGAEIIAGDSRSDELCKFGDTTLKVGQHFERLNFEDDFGRKFKKVKCECVIPPFATCTLG